MLKNGVLGHPTLTLKMVIFRMSKVDEDHDTLICNEIRLSSGGTLKIKDHRGFVIMELKEDGDLKLKGKSVKV